MFHSNRLESTQLAHCGSRAGYGLALVGVMVLITLPARAAIINVPGNQPTIQAGINAANPGDEVVAAPGTHAGGINFNGKAITVRSTDPTNPAVVAATIISGGASVVRCLSGEGPNSVLSGFVIRDGFIVGNGGGMRNVNSSPTVTHCTFIDNLAFNGNGGGMSNVNSNPTVTHCTFSNNESDFDSANGGGGGMYNSGSSPTVTSSTFSNNSALNGAGMYNLDGSSPEVTNCTFNANFAGAGGGIAVDSSAVELSNCTISGNFALSGGGVSVGWFGLTRLRNCTVTGNTANGQGGAVFVSPMFQFPDDTCVAAGVFGATDSTFCQNTSSGGGSQINGNFIDFDNFIGPVCPVIVDTDGDGVLDSNDVCPNNSPGLPVGSTGRPLLDCNQDCLVDGADIQCMVDQILNQ